MMLLQTTESIIDFVKKLAIMFLMEIMVVVWKSLTMGGKDKSTAKHNLSAVNN